MRHYNRQESIHVAIEKREGQERSEERDMSIKERRNRGPKLKMEGIYLGRKKERRRAKSEKWQTRGGVKIPSSSPDPLWAWHIRSLSLSPSSPPPAAATARPAWWCATQHLHPLHFTTEPPLPSITTSTTLHLAASPNLLLLFPTPVALCVCACACVGVCECSCVCVCNS
ncbi:hypothetical protein VPH35_111618 [Triticum aestivum]